MQTLSSRRAECTSESCGTSDGLTWLSFVYIKGFQSISASIKHLSPSFYFIFTVSLEMFPWIAIESKFYQERFLESKPNAGICEIPMSDV